MKKQIDIYKPLKWERNIEREKRLYPNEPDPMYWDYVDSYEEIRKHPRIINLNSLTF